MRSVLLSDLSDAAPLHEAFIVIVDYMPMRQAGCIVTFHNEDAAKTQAEVLRSLGQRAVAKSAERYVQMVHEQLYWLDAMEARNTSGSIPTVSMDKRPLLGAFLFCIWVTLGH